MKVASFDIVFQEIPGEVTLALNLSNCPCHCPGCHSPHLAEDIGEPLTEELLSGLLSRYGAMITCVCFMGGDAEPDEVVRWAEWVKSSNLKTAWYSGRPATPETFNSPYLQIVPSGKELSTFNYVKFGPYIEALGGLKSPRTNQRLYKHVENEWVDITSSFWKKNLDL